MSTRFTLVCGMLSLLAACGSPARICNGGSSTELNAFLTEGFVPYSVAGELGQSFLRVDGSCQFAVRKGYPLAPELLGVLDPALERSVSARLAFGDWPALAGRYPSQITDTPVLILDSGLTPATDVSCDDCSGRSTPILPIAAAYPGVIDDVALIGVEPTGAVRYRVWGPVEDPGFPVVDASTAPVDLASIAQPTPPLRDEVRVTTQQWEADSWRALRRAAANAGAPAIAARDAAGHIFRVDLRSILPSEGREAYTAAP